MQKILWILFFCLFLFPPPAVASSGLPQAMLINEEYPSQLPSIAFPKTYTPHQPIRFAINAKQLADVIPAEFLANATYLWNFGDGNKAEGREVSHTYKDQRVYLVHVVITIPVGVIETPTQYSQYHILSIQKQQTSVTTCLPTILFSLCLQNLQTFDSKQQE